MGIPRWRLQLTVVAQSLWVGLFGLCVAAPFTFVLAEAANRLGTRSGCTRSSSSARPTITLGMALGSGLAALRSFQRVDPAHNLR